MTNGEVLQKTFSNSESDIDALSTKVVFTLEPRTSGQQLFVFDKDWWNAEYKEPTTKNDLGVDCISRAYLYNRIKGIDHDEDYECDEFGGSKITYHTCDWDEVLREIEDAPSVTSQEPRWIPVSERLPDIHSYSEKYLVTLKRGGIHVAMFTECDGKHWWTHNIVAWMPLPREYREVEE